MDFAQSIDYRSHLWAIHFGFSYFMASQKIKEINRKWEEEK